MATQSPTRTSRVLLAIRRFGSSDLVTTLSSLSTKLTRNSSLTRVRPVFSAALDADVRGVGWLPALLAKAPAANWLEAAIRRDPGDLLGASTAHRQYKDRVLR